MRTDVAWGLICQSAHIFIWDAFIFAAEQQLQSAAFWSFIDSVQGAWFYYQLTGGVFFIMQIKEIKDL